MEKIKSNKKCIVLIAVVAVLSFVLINVFGTTKAFADANIDNSPLTNDAYNQSVCQPVYSPLTLLDPNIIDSFQVLKSVNPQDIESEQILKD